MRRIFSKQILIVASLVSGVFGMVLYAACIKDQCKGIACANSGVCVAGICTCPSGYEGAHCDTLWSYKFSGTWNNTEIIQDSNGLHNTTYQVTVQADTVANGFVINNLEGGQNGIHCQLTAVKTFNVLAQSNIDSSFYITSGNGGLDSLGNINIIYNFVQNHLPRAASMAWSR